MFDLHFVPHFQTCSAFSLKADSGMGFDPITGKNFEIGNVPRKKQFVKRKSDDVLVSPTLRRSKRTKKQVKTNEDVIDISSDSEDDNIVITESETAKTAIAEKEECDVTKVKIDGVQAPRFLSHFVFKFTHTTFPFLVPLETTCDRRKGL